MSNIGFRIYTEIERPPQELIEEFGKLPVANIGDSMGRTACIDSRIKPFNEVPLIGTAFTVLAPQGDNLMFHKAIDLAQPGDVVVVAGEGDMTRALCGDRMMRYAKFRGIAGFLIDGCVRDIDALKTMGFAVFARGANPNGPYKNGPGEINVPVCIGGQVVCPGDIVVGNSDGVVVIKAADARSLLEKAKKLNEKERSQEKKIENGNWDRSWIDKELNEKGCEIINQKWGR